MTINQFDCNLNERPITSISILINGPDIPVTGYPVIKTTNQFDCNINERPITSISIYITGYRITRLPDIRLSFT